MPVAKTYARFPIDGDVFIENKRMYVNVKTSKGLKKVRWYSDAEYRRMYPDVPIQDIMMSFNARHAFGFGDAGYVTLYKGPESEIEAWAHSSWPPKAWHNLTFGYYTPSKFDVGEPPKGVEPIVLTWDEVKQDTIHMKSHEEVRKYVDVLLGTSTPQTNEWTPGDWIEKTLIVGEKETKEGNFGTKHTYTMYDAEGNIFVWETGARDYKVDVEVSLKMKVKEVKDDRIIVWYCKEI